MALIRSLILMALVWAPVACKTISSEIKADPMDRGVLVSAMKDMGITNLTDEQMDQFADHLLEKTRPQNTNDTTIDSRNNYAQVYMQFRDAGGNQEKLQDWLTAGLAAYSNYIEMQLNGGVFLLRDPYEDGE